MCPFLLLKGWMHMSLDRLPRYIMRFLECVIANTAIHADITGRVCAQAVCSFDSVKQDHLLRLCQSTACDILSPILTAAAHFSSRFPHRMIVIALLRFARSSSCWIILVSRLILDGNVKFPHNIHHLCITRFKWRALSKHIISAEQLFWPQIGGDFCVFRWNVYMDKYFDSYTTWLLD